MNEFYEREMVSQNDEEDNDEEMTSASAKSGSKSIGIINKSATKPPDVKNPYASAAKP